MKTLLRNIIIYSLALYVLSIIVGGVHILGGLPTYVIGGFVLMLLQVVLRPVLNILTLPLNLITLGLFAVITSSIILYLLTVLVPRIVIRAYDFPGTSIAGFIIPPLHLNSWATLLLSAVVLSSIVWFITWLTN
jgi:putative membrane protein